jgi:hypothetical protein
MHNFTFPAGPSKEEKKAFLDGFSTEDKGKQFKRDGSDDYKILGSEKLKANKFAENMETTAKDIEEAYNKRLAIINEADEEDEEKQLKMQTGERNGKYK